MPFRFNMLLDEVGIDPTQVRLLRHQPKVAGKSLLDIVRADRASFEAYQALQQAAKRSLFAHIYWAAFVGTWDGRTVFVGLYAPGAPETLLQDDIAPLSGAVEQAGEVDRYPARHLDLLAAYEGKLYVDWGGGPSGKRAWVQRADLQDKLVTELHLDGAEQPFPGLMELATPLSALDAAPPGWISQLSTAKGVYLLTCPRDGSLYVGSATGDGGFWGRWSEYRANGHGGNVALIGRERSDFIVSVLQVAGSADGLDAILAMESAWKRKLATRTFGLTRN